MAWQLRLPGFATAAAWLCNRGDPALSSWLKRNDFG
jgi:hypothetical protein